MTSQGQLLATITAGTAGALVATLAVGASILLVVPAVIGVSAIAYATDRGARTRDDTDMPHGWPSSNALNDAGTSASGGDPEH